MEKTNYIHPYLKVDFWVSHLEKLYGEPHLKKPLRKYDIVEPIRSLITWYSWGSFVVGFFQEEDRKRPVFYIFYEPSCLLSESRVFRYSLDFDNIAIFMDFLQAIKNPSLFPLCINFKPARNMLPGLSASIADENAHEIISSAIKDLS
jgi:hypothetical protein